ncbi:MAG: ATP-grasp domain-containing protein [Chloroflexia bacterium]
MGYEDLVAGRVQAAVRRVPEQSPPEVAVYRGWMLKPSDYAAMYDALPARGVLLVNSPEEYRHCHYLPESYSVIEGVTAATAWMPLSGGEALDFEAVMALLRELGGGPVVLKDYVKPQKHYWEEACYIPDAADRAGVERVVRRFLELQGEDLAGGLVFREFVPLAAVSRHPQSAMPLSEEYRVFFLDGNPIYTVPYWEYGDYPAVGPPVHDFLGVAGQVRSRFFTMDLARRAGGTWMVIELGDAQVAGLPERGYALELYKALASHL